MFEIYKKMIKIDNLQNSPCRTHKELAHKSKENLHIEDDRQRKTLRLSLSIRISQFRARIRLRICHEHSADILCIPCSACRVDLAVVLRPLSIRDGHLKLNFRNKFLFVELTEGKAVASVSPEHVELQIVIRRQHSFEINISSWRNIGQSRKIKTDKSKKFHFCIDSYRV